MFRYKLTLEYDGTGLNGWQKQQDCPTVQGLLEAAVKGFCGRACEVMGSGRTDAGVHASGQVAHVDLPQEYDGYTVMSAINHHLVGQRIAVTHAEMVDSEFHARFSARARHYEYRILNRRARPGLWHGYVWHVPEELDAEAMHKAAQILLGQHDFTTFRDSQCQARSPIKTLDRLDVERRQDVIFVRASARSFLHHQVRILVGSLKMVGAGRWDRDDLARALAARDRSKGGPTAGAEGLFLMKVDYPA